MGAGWFVDAAGPLPYGAVSSGVLIIELLRGHLAAP
jgi:hypothetical protein